MASKMKKNARKTTRKSSQSELQISKKAAIASPSIKDVVSALEKCIDPELGVNVVDLGFIYGISIKGGDVKVRMTLSSTMCPLAGMITEDISQKVERVKGAKDVTVEMVWNPLWSIEMFSERFKKQFSHRH
jgi:metal-sulfur cluster biosynthetic enzyme